MKSLNLVGFNDGSRHLVLDEQLVFAVRLALEARFLLHGVLWTITRRGSLLQWRQIFHKDERFEYRPVVQERLNTSPAAAIKMNRVYQLKSDSTVPFRVWSCSKIVNPWQRRFPGDH